MAFHPSPREAEAGQPGLHSDFRISQGYRVRPCLHPPNSLKSEQSCFEQYSRTLSAGTPHAGKGVFRTKVIMKSSDAVWDSPATIPWIPNVFLD